jgi:PAS domain S-box-containing protein
VSRFTKSLRFKVTLLVIGVELLILTGVGVYYSHRFSQEVDNAITARLSIPGLLMSHGDLSFGAVSDKRTMEGLLRAPYSKGFVIGMDGRVYFSSDPTLLDTHLDEIDGLRFPDPGSSPLSSDALDLITPLQDSTGTYLTSLTPLRPDGKLTGYLYLKVGTEISEAEKINIAILFAIGSLATILLTAAILTWLLNLTIIRRLNDLVGLFHRFSQGNYTVRAQPLGSGDEIAVLMYGFNSLAQRLEDAMANLKESEQSYRLVFENSPVSIWEEDFSEVKKLLDGLKHQGVSDIEAYLTQHPETLEQCAEQVRIVAVNHVALTLHEAENYSELLAGLSKTFTPESYESFKQELICLWSGQTTMVLDTVVKTLTGESRNVTVYFTVCPGYEETLAKVIVSLVDITERKQATDRLLLLSERLQLATHVAQIGIWDWDVVNNELLWDESMYQLYGIQQENFGGAYEAWACTIHPEDRSYAEGEIQAALRGEREYAPEFRIVWPDGSIRYIKAESKTIQDLDGKPLRMIGTNIDISERKHSEDKLRHYQDQLEETVQQRTAELLLARDAAEAANKAKSVFLANMSHELRTPLNAILGFSQFMHMDQTLKPSQHEILEIINSSGNHLLKLINDVLEIAKIEAGKLQLESTTFDLHKLVREVFDMMRLPAQQKGLKLMLDQASEFPRYVRGDEARLRQVLVNMVSNAVKFTETGGVTIRLRAQKKAQQLLLIEVEDTGPGISEADQQRLFKPFVQLPEGAAKGGTGLGLAIISQVVKLMEGNITVESKLGFGTLFRVALPLEEAEEPEVIPLTSMSKGEVISLAPGQPAYRILIAEDQPDNQKLLSRMMNMLGLEVRVAHDGKEALELFQEWCPELIWMDQRMPVMDGIEATRRIRQLPHGDKVKIVAVTASAFKEQEEEMRAAGMDDYVSKPYRFNEIYDSMGRQLGLRFIYSQASTEPEERGLKPQMLRALPDEVRTELRIALKSLDAKVIENAIRRVSNLDDELAKRLTKITSSLDYPKILNALKDGDR